VEPHEVRALLDPLPIRRLFGVGPVTERALVAAGFRSFAEVAAADPAQLAPILGERAAELCARARGEDERPVEADRAAKSYGEENTFEQDLRDGEEISRALTGHAHAIARRLRRDGLQGRTVTLKARMARRSGAGPARVDGGHGRPDLPEMPRYPLKTRSRSLPTATDDAALIRRVALELWHASGIREPIRLIGISVTNLSRHAPGQLSLFDAAERRAAERSQKLGPALDAIRARFGEAAIAVGTGAADKLTPSSQKKRGE
jgi:DNA polymerase-4